MADYRLSVSTISRGQGKSVMAAAAYRAGQCLTDQRTGRVHDYSRKQGVEYRGISCPRHAPDWARSRESLWNEVERAETRVNSRTAREFQLSLPHELNFEQRKALVLEFVSTELAGKGMVADIALHKPGREGDQRNYHAHILVTTRPITPDGFGPKAREWNSVEQLDAWRQSWAAMQNRHLEQALGQQAPKVSHLSLTERSILRPAQMHLGPHVSAMERRGLRTERGDRHRMIKEIGALDAARRQMNDKIDGLKYGMAPRAIDGLALDLKKAAYRHSQDAAKAEQELKAVLAAKRAHPPLGVKRVREDLLAPEKQALVAAKRDYEARKAKVGVKAPFCTVMAWLRNPSKQLFRTIARDLQLDRAAMAYATAKQNYARMVARVDAPANRRQVETVVAESQQAFKGLRGRGRQLRIGIAQSKRLAERATLTMNRMTILRDAGVAVAIPMPKQIDDPRRFIRCAELGTLQTVNALKPEIRTNLVQLLARGLSGGLSLGQEVKR